jgi:lysophospholipase L1-like esterase
MTAVSLDASTRLLFIGDSITDCNRSVDPDQLGDGYVRLVRDYLAAHNPAKLPVVINRGISGNKIPDLQKRWKTDVLEMRPDVLSIFIGINDVWHSFKPDRSGCDLPAFRAGYEDILTQTRHYLPATTLVLCEPSVLWLDHEHPGANAKLAPYIAAVHELAKRFGAQSVVELHGAFNRAKAARPDVAWTTDGVHPTSTGHMLIAQTWLKATGLL